MFTDNKNQTSAGNQLIDNTGAQPSSAGQSDQPAKPDTDGVVGTIYTMPNAKPTPKIKEGGGKSSPKAFIIIGTVVVIIIAAVGWWFYSSMTAPADNLLDVQDFNTNNLLPPQDLDDQPAVDEDVSQTTPIDRDQQRLDDVTAVRSALALYYQEMKAYPDILDDLLDKHLDAIPINPKPGGNFYVYVPQDANQSYKFVFSLEEGGQLGALNLQAGEYQASPSLIQPLLEVDDNLDGDSGDAQNDTDAELLSGLDSDSDGLTDIEENLYETSSTLVDSDEDGYSDASELVNLYDPSVAGALLSDNDTATQYINTKYNYSVLYPSVWTVRALTEDKMEVIFNSETTEFIQVLVLENPLGLSARNWYLNNNSEVDEDSLIEVVVNNVVGVQTANGRYTYLGVGSNIYSIIYNVGTTNQLNYQATYDMMLQSWELITVDEGLPGEERDDQRLQDITDIRFGLLEYQVANLSLPTNIDDDVDSYQMIGTTSDDCAYICDNVSTATQCVDITADLAPEHMASIPYDPLDGSEEMTGYYINLLTDGTLIAGVCKAEVADLIEVNN